MGGDVSIGKESSPASLVFSARLPLLIIINLNHHESSSLTIRPILFATVLYVLTYGFVLLILLVGRNQVTPLAQLQPAVSGVRSVQKFLRLLTKDIITPQKICKLITKFDICMCSREVSCRAR